MKEGIFLVCCLAILFAPRIIQAWNAPRIAKIQAEERVRIVEAVARLRE